MGSTIGFGGSAEVRVQAAPENGGVGAFLNKTRMPGRGHRDPFQAALSLQLNIK